MPAAVYDLVIEQGSSYEVTFLYTDLNNLPVDVTNFCVLLQWRTNTDNIYAFTNKYDGTDYSLVSNKNGTIVLKIPSKTTNLYDFDNAAYDLDLQEPNEEYPGSGLTSYRLSTGSVFIVRRNVPASLTNCANVSAGFELQDNCDIECGKLDIYSVTYNGSGVTINDLSTSISTISVEDTRSIENVEIAINGLNHNSPQDLLFIVSPPSGGKVLLSANAKILNYRPGFSCMFSNRASNNDYISNIKSGGLCNIYNKTSFTRYNNEILLSSFGHLYNSPASGNWSLYLVDNDITGSGSLDSWKLIVTYQAPLSLP
jgi:subtilisin-like proprotein convertase family protein